MICVEYVVFSRSIIPAKLNAIFGERNFFFDLTPNCVCDVFIVLDSYLWSTGGSAIRAYVQ